MATTNSDEIPLFYRDLAKKTINENPKHTAAHLSSFKRWLSSSPHLIVPDNDLLLLSFLRYAHFEHATAQRRLDIYCTLRCSKKEEVSSWFDYPPLTDPIVDKYLKMGIFVPLGFVKSGSFFVLIRLNKWKIEQISQLQMRTLNNMIFEQFLFDHRCQIGGFGLLIDMSGTNIELAMRWADGKNAKSAFKLMQEASPGRVKHLVFYKESKTFDFAFKMVEAWISEKMRERILRIKDNIQKGYKKIPGLVDVMPEEYGGNNGTMDEIIEKATMQFKEFYSKQYPLNGIGLDESMRPPSAKYVLKEYKDYEPQAMGTEGTIIQIDPED